MEPETRAERELVAALAADRELEAHGWPDGERAVRRSFLRALLSARGDAVIGASGVRARNLLFPEGLDLAGLGSEGAPLPSVSLEACRFDGPINAEESFFRSLSLFYSDTRGVGLRGVRVVFDLALDFVDARGEVNLKDARIGGHLMMNAVWFDGRPRDAAGEIVEAVNDYRALFAEGMRVGGDVRARPWGGPRPRRALFAGQVRMLGVDVGGDISFSGASLTGEVRQGTIVSSSLSLERSVIAGSLICDDELGYRFDAQGAVNAMAARIGGSVEMSGSRVRFHPVCLTLSQATVGQNVRLAGRLVPLYPESGEATDEPVETFAPFEARGEVMCVGLKVGGTVDVSGARLENPDGDAFSADEARFGRLIARAAWGGDRWRPLEVQGTFRLMSTIMARAEIADSVVLRAEAPEGGWRDALTMSGATVEGDLILSISNESVGRVSLEHATVGNLPILDPDCLGRPPTLEGGRASGVLLDLDELTYDRADIDEGCRKRHQAQPLARFRRRSDHAIWIRLLELQFPGERPSFEHFKPQPYEQAARLLRAKGDAYGAGRIATAKRDLQRRCGVDRGVGAVGHWLFKIFFDYGYSPGLALTWGVVLLVLGYAGARHLDLADALAEKEARTVYQVNGERLEPVNTRPPKCRVSRVALAIDEFFPLVDLNVSERCAIRTTYRYARQAEYLRTAYGLAGLVFVPLATLTFAGVLRRD